MRISDAARVIGTNKETFRTRVISGSYNIRFGKDGRGWKFDTEDVFRTAYPFAGDEIIANLIMQFRERKRQENVTKG